MGVPCTEKPSLTKIFIIFLGLANSQMLGTSLEHKSVNRKGPCQTMTNNK